MSVCINKFCTIMLKGKQKKYCSRECNKVVFVYERSERTKLKHEIDLLRPLIKLELSPMVNTEEPTDCERWAIIMVNSSIEAMEEVHQMFKV